MSYLSYVIPLKSFTHGEVTVNDFGRFLSVSIGKQHPITLSRAQVADMIRALRDATVTE